jgi:hypothetical protein
MLVTTGGTRTGDAGWRLRVGAAAAAWIGSWTGGRLTT